MYSYTVKVLSSLSNKRGQIGWKGDQKNVISIYIRWKE